MNKRLFFLAILPPRTISEEITAFKHEASRLFNAKHALNAPAHITVIPPFWSTNEHEASLLKTLSQINSELQEFEIECKGFGQFDPNVLFVHVESSVEMLACFNLCRKHIEEFLKEKLELRKIFHPHATIAFKDLDKSLVQPAFKHFNKKTYEKNFYCSEVSLLCYIDRTWQIV